MNRTVPRLPKPTETLVLHRAVVCCGEAHPLLADSRTALEKGQVDP
jgi:hypothetical protein